MDETDPQKLASELEQDARELADREEEVGKQIASARETWKTHRETTAPPAPDAPTEHTPEQEASMQPPEDEAESRQVKNEAEPAGESEPRSQRQPGSRSEG